MPGTAKTHPCVFRGSIVREQIDPRVKQMWEDRFGSRAPFGDLRLMFREAHCTTLNPYSSGTCPYTERQCAIAFYRCVKTTVEYARDRKGAVGYFRAVAKSYGIERADNKPLARYGETQGPRDTGTPRPGDPPRHVSGGEAGQHDRLALRRINARPSHIGDLLRGIDPRPRQGPTDDG